MKRYFYLWHRWLGIVLCGFMALWFVSGVVMMYVGYPKLSPREHLAHLPPLVLNECCADLATVLAASGQGVAPLRIRLSQVAGEPRYLLGYSDRPSVAVDARTGQRIAPVDANQALASARQFGGHAAVRYDRVVDEDLWSHSRGLDAERPLHRVGLADSQERLLYVSGQTGAVVRDATARERFWNYGGAWLHWLYPLRGLGIDQAWTHIVIYLSLAATLMALLGSVIGVLRWRFKKTYRSGSHSPYQGIARWHHIGGLLFGVLCITWVFSGLMSMNPWKIFSAEQPLAVANYTGGELRAQAFGIEATEALRHFKDSGFVPRELEWRRVGGQGYIVGYDGGGQTRLLSMSDGRVLEQLEMAELEQAAQAISPTSTFISERVEQYDFWYYGRAEQSMLGHVEKRLPILRLRFDDPARTWVQLDPFTGEVLGQMDQSQRVARWLFTLLHSWDWLPLLERRPLWDILMIVFSAGGLLLSLTGMVLGWRRLRRWGRSVR